MSATAALHLGSIPRDVAIDLTAQSVEQHFETLDVHYKSPAQVAGCQDNESPTQQVYAPLQQAFDFYNARLFGGSLPSCLITVQRQSIRTLGYYWHDRFGHVIEKDRLTDEIALNPAYFQARGDEDVPSTLVHEMCHLWQARLGKKCPRSAYHNKEFREKMKQVGLQTSSTGAPGGKTVGQSMTHYILPNGLFQVVTQELISTGFRLSWYERNPRVADLGSAEPSQPEVPPPATASKSGTRVRFECQTCDAKAWGKSTLRLICGRCTNVMSWF